MTENKDFTTTFLEDQTPKEGFVAINNVCRWWSENIEGDSQKLNDELDVGFGDVHQHHQWSKKKVFDL